MNQPIGIPSGWEEIAACIAYYGTPRGAQDDSWDSAKTRSEYYGSERHDWRVED